MLGLDGFMDSDLLLLRKKVMPLVFGELKAVTFGHDVRGLGIWTEGFQLAKRWRPGRGAWGLAV